MAVAEFLRAGTSLLEAVVVNRADHLEVVRWIEQFQGFVTSLEHGDIVDTAISGAGVEKACWKISQDVLIRLRRLEATRTRLSSEMDDPNGGLRSVFTEQDIESLRTQLFRIQMRWQSLQLEEPL